MNKALDGMSRARIWMYCLATPRLSSCNETVPQ